MRLTACDGPDCTEVAADPTGDDAETVDGWLHVEGWNDADDCDCCSWQCLANVAMSRVLD